MGPRGSCVRTACQPAPLRPLLAAGAPLSSAGPKAAGAGPARRLRSVWRPERRSSRAVTLLPDSLAGGGLFPSENL